MSFLVVCTSGIWQVPIIQEAHRNGVKTIAIDSDENAQGLKISDFKIVAPLNELEYIVSKIKEITECIIGAVSYCSDAGVQLSQDIMNHFACDLNTHIESDIFTNKVLQRERWLIADILQPKYRAFESKEEALKLARRKKLPFVLKPADSSGSRGVTIVTKRDSIFVAIDQAFQFSKNGQILLEDFMPGTEYTVEVFASNKRVVPLLVTRKEKVDEETKTVSRSLWSVNPESHFYNQIVELATSAFEAIGLTRGPGHLELILDKNLGPLGVIEAAARGGGFNLSTNLIQVTTGFNFLSKSLELFLNNEIEIMTTHYNPSVLFFYPTKKGRLVVIDGLSEVIAMPFVQVTILGEIGKSYENAKTDADRLCTVVVSASSEEELVSRVAKVKSTLIFRFEE